MRWGFLLLILACGPALADPSVCGETLNRAVPPPPPNQPVEALLMKKCGVCHAGLVLNYARVPFFSDRFVTPETFRAETLRRVLMSGYGKMPPVNASPLTDDEIKEIRAWADLF